MKEKEIKDEFVKIKVEKDNKGLKFNKIMLIFQVVLIEEEREFIFVKRCIECWRKVRFGEVYIIEEKIFGCCFCILSLFCCGCCNFVFDDKGNSKCCVKLKKKFKIKKRFEEELIILKEKIFILEEKILKNFINNCYDYVLDCFWWRWLGMFFCGCCNFLLDDEGNCKCCVILIINVKLKKIIDSFEEWIELYDIQRLYWICLCFCVKDCLNKDIGENFEEKINFFNEFKIDILYKIIVDIVDEIRLCIIYNVKVEIINDGIIEFEKISILDKFDENK